MAIGKIMKKLIGSGKDSEGNPNRRLTPDEVELQSYKREQYLDNVKKEVAEFRKKKDQEALVGNPMTSGKSILAQKNVFGGKTKKKECGFVLR